MTTKSQQCAIHNWLNLVKIENGRSGLTMTGTYVPALEVFL